MEGRRGVGICVVVVFLKRSTCGSLLWSNTLPSTAGHNVFKHADESKQGLRICCLAYQVCYTHVDKLFLAKEGTPAASLSIAGKALHSLTNAQQNAKWSLITVDSSLQKRWASDLRLPSSKSADIVVKSYYSSLTLNYNLNNGFFSGFLWRESDMVWTSLPVLIVLHRWKLSPRASDDKPKQWLWGLGKVSASGARLMHRVQLTQGTCTCAHRVRTWKSMDEREMPVSKMLERTRNVASISDFMFVLVW